MSRWTSDIRLAFRRLHRSPAFTTVAVLTLALGFGANLAVFGVINALFLKPMPGVAQPDALVQVNRASENFTTMSYPNYRDVADTVRGLSGMAGYRFAPIALGWGADRARVWSYLVTGGYFDLLGAKPLLGRPLTASDDVGLGAHPVVVLAYEAWQQRLGGDPDVIGRTLKINGLDYAVVGVMPAGFHGTEVFYKPELWVPLHMQPQIEARGSWLESRRTSNLFVIGRLAPGVGADAAERELGTIAARLAHDYPDANAGFRLQLSPAGLLGTGARGPVMGFSGVLLAVTALVLLIACTNLADLLLARAADREREVAIRLACGAARTQLVRQFLLESFVLSLAGAVAGLLVTFWITSLFVAWRPPVDFPFTLDLTLDLRVLAFGLGACVLTTVLFGLAPALRAARQDVASALRARTGRELWGRWHLRDLFVGLQIALALLLLVSAIIVVRGLRESMRIDVGFNPRGAVAASFDLGLQGYTKTRGAAAQQQVLDRARALPGVEAAGLISTLPLAMDRSMNDVTIEGQPAQKDRSLPSAFYYQISPGYLEAAQTRRLAGRAFTDADADGTTRVAIVNEAFARQLMPGRDALNQRFRFGAGGPWTQIVGIVERGKHGSLTAGPAPAVFAPLAQSGGSLNATLVVRSSRSAEDALRDVREVMRALDPDVALYETGSLEQQLALALFPTRMAAALLSAFGLLALTLAATGIYGAIAYAVARRTREIGIRLAIGAQRRDILALTAGRGGALLAVSLALGLAAAIPLTRLLAHVAAGVDSTSPTAFVLAALLLCGVAVLAATRPLRAATRVDPVQALRQE